MAGRTTNNGATLDFQSQLWAAADKLRGHMDASEYKHVVLGLIFLKYISDSFEEVHASLLQEKDATPKTGTNIWRKMSSGCRRKRAGHSCAAKPSNPRSANSWTMA
jgi:type I restriction-modification system DNA methylase subunit